MHPMQSHRLPIDHKSGVDQRNDTENGFASFGSEDDLHGGLHSEEFDAGEAVFTFGGLFVGELIEGFAFWLDTGVTQGLCGGEAIQQGGIDEKFGGETFAAAGEIANGSRDVRRTHFRNYITCSCNPLFNAPDLEV